MTKIDVEIGKQHAVIFDQHIFRPHGITPSQWKKFWREVAELKIDLSSDANDSDDEIKMLNGVIVDLQNELQSKADY